MKKVDINLNQTELGPENTPLMVTRPEGQSDKEAPTNYPHFHYEGKDELPIPHKGKMTIEYEIVWEQETETPNSDHYACKVEVRKILATEAAKENDEAPTRRDTSTEDALDRLMEEREAEEGDED